MTSALTSLSESSSSCPLDNHLLHQVRNLLKRLCHMFGVQEPPEVESVLQLARQEQNRQRQSNGAAANKDAAGKDSHGKDIELSITMVSFL